MSQTKQSLMQLCSIQPGATHDYKDEWQADRFLLTDKMFAMLGTNKEGTPIITLKCDPDKAVQLREEYPFITPGYYMNKTHWNSIPHDAPLSTAEWTQMIQHSHACVFWKLPKKVREQLQ
ncbi:MAG: MmcQ/YjbR family DNA-binding protein [Bacilli bacterium]